MLLKKCILAGLFFISNFAYADSIIVDHTCTDLTQIPQSAIEAAKANLVIAYGHTSHGSQLTTGMDDLVDFINGGGLDLSMPQDIFDFNSTGTGGALQLRDTPFSGANDLGSPNFTAWETATRNYLDAHHEVNVIIWSWCGQASWASETDIDTYINLMEGLIEDYQNVQFVFMTGHLDGTGATGNLNIRNQQIRDHCIANNRILYDFADIESYDPNALTHYMPLLADDNCDYDSDGNSSRDRNWAIDWQNSHTIDVDWYDCTSAHSRPLNANRKAYAAWWLWAQLAGWNPSSGNFTIRLQNTSELDDAFLYQSMPDTNFGADSSGQDEFERYIVKFNFPPALNGKRILEATIGFNGWTQQFNEPDQYLQLFRVTQHWQQDNVTWNNATSGTPWSTPGGQYDLLLAEIPFVEGIENEYYPPADITDIVQKWVRDKTDNHGLMLINNSLNDTNLYAAEHTGDSTFLEITYTDPCPVDASADINYDCKINLLDYAQMSRFWLTAEKCADIAPPEGDNIVNLNDLNEFILQWLQGYL
ncbi:MAG: DNRLRE domain-containing protein [Planctomycetes bacterium]|nr:DNRLRE domain-containing protein [Planctomycetota bacterium]